MKTPVWIPAHGWTKILPLGLLLTTLTTPAWACGEGLGSLVVLALAFFGMETFLCSLAAGILTQWVLKRKMAFPKLTLVTAVTLGSVAGFVGFLVTSGSGDTNLIVGATGIISSLVAAATTACGPRAKMVLIDQPTATAEPSAISAYDSAQEWKPL